MTSKRKNQIRQAIVDAVKDQSFSVRSIIVKLKVSETTINRVISSDPKLEALVKQFRSSVVGRPVGTRGAPKHEALIVAAAKDCIKSQQPISVAELARQLKNGRDCVLRILRKHGLYSAFRELTAPNATIDLKVLKERQQSRDLRQGYKDALKRIAELEQELKLHQDFRKIGSEVIARKVEIKKHAGKKDAVAFVEVSDWHLEEQVLSAAVGGVNSFNLTIARKRVNLLFQHTMKLLRMCRRESYIKTLVVTALGDFMTAWIHEEFLSSNMLTPPEAMLEVFELWLGGLKYWLDEGDLDEILFVGVCGNHGRITKKMPTKKMPQKNYEWLIYQYLMRWFAENPPKKTKIRFKMPEGYFNWIKVFGRDIRIHHGDGIRYMGGVGGIHIPLRKAIAQWNKAKHADLDIMAHWHTRENSRDYTLNGSLIGYSEYSQRLKTDFEPPAQSFFILHHKYGKTAEFPIVLE